MSCIYGGLAATRGVGDCQPGSLQRLRCRQDRNDVGLFTSMSRTIYLCPLCTCVESEWLPWCSVLCKHLNSPAIGIRDDNGSDGDGLLIPALYRYLTSSVWLEYIIRWHMNCLRGGRVVTRGVGACQFDSHRRLWWQRGASGGGGFYMSSSCQTNHRFDWI